MSTNQTQKIGLAVATIVGMNAMIGAGIFAVPAALASHVGPAGIITYAFVILAVWFMGSSIARLAQLFPQEGSFYTYAKQWGGHKLGLIAAGSYLLGLLIAMGLLSQMAGLYLYTYLPFFSAYTWGIIALATLTLLNIVGVVFSQAGQIVLICTTVFPLVTSIILCLTKADFSNLQPFMPYGLTNVFAATKAVIFGFFGFECAASLFNVVEEPEKNVSKALTLSIILVGSLYMLFVVALILAIPLDQFSTDKTLPQILATVFPENTWLIFGVHLSILSAILGTIHSMIWSSSSLLISYLKQFKNKTIKKYLQTGIFNHRIAVLVVGFCILLTFLLFNNIDLFFGFTACFIVFAYATSIISLLIVEKDWKAKVTTMLGLITATIIFYFAVEGIVKILF